MVIKPRTAREPAVKRAASATKIVGFDQGKDLLLASRVRAGFIPATREVFAKIKHLKATKCRS